MKPLNGIVQKRDSNQNKTFECYFVNGKKDGPIKMWCSKGNLFFSGYYKEGLPHGTFEWSYANGKPSAKCTFLGGRLNGKCEEWYSEYGQLKYEENYSDGLLFGVQRYYSKDGKSLGGGDLKNGNGTIKIYFENSIISSERPYLGGLLNGTVKNYHTNGKLKSEENYNAGMKHGIHKTWDINGIIESEVMYENGTLNGLARIWSKGVLKNEYNYTDDINSSPMGSPVFDKFLSQLPNIWCYRNEIEFIDFFNEKKKIELCDIKSKVNGDGDNPFGNGGSGGRGTSGFLNEDGPEDDGKGDGTTCNNIPTNLNTIINLLKNNVPVTKPASVIVTISIRADGTVSSVKVSGLDNAEANVEQIIKKIVAKSQCMNCNGKNKNSRTYTFPKVMLKID